MNCATTCLLESRRENDYKVKVTAIVNDAYTSQVYVVSRNISK